MKQLLTILILTFALNSNAQEIPVITVENRDSLYKAWITEADSAFSSRQYEESKKLYLRAATIKTDRYPNDKIAECDALIQREKELLKQKPKNNQNPEK